IMLTGAAIPKVTATTRLGEALMEISRKGLGMTTVTGPSDVLLGIFTDGDLRRALDADIDVRNTPIGGLMTCGAKTIAPNLLAAEALRIMEEHKITALVVQRGEQMVGVVHLMNLLHAGIA
ncbi:MAG: CBS domain-containing protein, partial [Haliea sp.]|nr:CBS domain-containing protein [Haliea sp.]